MKELVNSCNLPKEKAYRSRGALVVGGICLRVGKCRRRSVTWLLTMKLCIYCDNKGQPINLTAVQLTVAAYFAHDTYPFSPNLLPLPSYYFLPPLTPPPFDVISSHPPLPTSQHLEQWRRSSITFVGGKFYTLISALEATLSSLHFQIVFTELYEHSNRILDSVIRSTVFK